MRSRPAEIPMSVLSPVRCLAAAICLGLAGGVAAEPARFVTEAGAGGAACVLDRQTGLTWERRAPAAVAPTYVAALPRGGVSAARCGAADPAACSTQAYAARVNAQQLCGHADWRLPTQAELKTLLDFSHPGAGVEQPAIDMAAFPDAQAGFYWTGTPHRAGGVLAVWFDDTHRELPSTALQPSRAGLVRLVRGAGIADKVPAAPARLIRLDRTGRPAARPGDWQCVDDALRRDSLRTLTVWQLGAKASGPVRATTLAAAVRRLNRDNFCGVAAWRLPDEAELAGLWQTVARNSAATGIAPERARAYWVHAGYGPPRVWQPASGRSRPARPGEAAGSLLISTTPRPQQVRPAPAPEARPTAAELAGWRAAYARYRPGQAEQPDWPVPEVDESARRAGFADLGLLPAVPFPADNPYSPAKVALGQKLFFDVRLSRNNQLSCASCHDPATGWTDRRDVSLGHIGQRGERNSMIILNTAYVTELFWDGRARSLEEQARGPIPNPLEMHQSTGMAVEKIAAAPEYGPLFAGAFGDAKVDIDRIARALATFERTLTSRDSAFDRFLKGERTALSDEALWGLQLFRTKARCINCHNGALFSDNRFHNNGLHYFGRELEDLGRYAVTGDVADIGKFRTPTLRDILYSGNYMHNGLFPLTANTGVLAMYDAGMVQAPPLGAHKYAARYPRIAPEIRPLGLSTLEKKALFAFLEAISAEPRREPATPREMGL